MAQLNEAKCAAAAVKQRRVDLATANDTERRRRSGEHRAITDFPTDPPCLSTSSAAAAARPTLTESDWGIPAQPIPTRTAEEVRWDGNELLTCWCPMPQHQAHPNFSHAEDPEYIIFHAPDPTVFRSEATDHTPIMWWHSEQRAAADAAGASYDLIEGPSPYGGWAELPASFESMHINPASTWSTMVTDMEQTARQQRLLRTQGIPLRPQTTVGGKVGVSYNITDAIFPQWQRVPWKTADDGKPVPREPALPDGDTKVKLHDMYAEGIRRRIADMDILSETRLYGLRSGTTADDRVRFCKNYSIDQDGLEHMDAERAEAILEGHIVPGPLRPTGIPFMANSKGVITQIKPGGRVKRRTVTDAGCIRQPRETRTKMIWDVRGSGSWWSVSNSNQSLHQLIAEDGSVFRAESTGISHSVISHAVSRTLLSDGLHLTRKSFLAKKGKPGLDSVNELIPKRPSCRYADFQEWCRGNDILISSGVPVDIVCDDFKGWYSQFPLGEGDKFYSNQLVSGDSVDQGLRAEFGIRHLPDSLNRLNFVMCEMIEQDAATIMTEFFNNPSPWSPTWVTLLERFVWIRKGLGCSAKLWCCYPYFDDCCDAVIRPLTERFRKLRYDTWTRFHWEIQASKATVNRWGATAADPVVGFEIHPFERKWWLPTEKVARYTGAIDAVIDAALLHPKHLVLLSQTDSMMGKIASAAEAVTRIWRHYGSLVSLITCQKFEQYSLYHPEMIVLLQRIKHELATQPGRPLTPYRLRPGEDDRPVWQNFNDASRRTDSWFGAAGGWFRLWETDVVFYFWHLWPPGHVEQCNIAELELQAAMIALHLQLEVHEQLFGRNSPHYTLVAGDNSSISDYCLNTMRASKPGLRWQIQRLAATEDNGNRLLSSKQCHREFNTAADHLANGALQAFLHCICSVAPRATCIRLTVPHSSADLSELIAWKQQISTYSGVVAAPQKNAQEQPRQ
jgi:hypothetical protein